MNIAIMCHTKKQDLMVQFCTAYCGILSKHTVCATNATGKMIADATGLNVNLFLSHELGGIEQIIHGGIKEENHIDLVVADSLTDLFNSAQFMGEELIDIQSRGIGDHLSSGVGSADSMLGQDAAIRSTELNHQVLLFRMTHNCDVHGTGTSYFLCDFQDVIAVCLKHRE